MDLELTEEPNVADNVAKVELTSVFKTAFVSFVGVRFLDVKPGDSLIAAC